MSRKAEIIAPVCTNKIRAAAASAADKVTWTVVPKGKNTGRPWRHVIHGARRFQGEFSPA